MKKTAFAKTALLSALAIITAFSAVACGQDNKGGSSSADNGSAAQVSTAPALYGTRKNEDITERMFFTFSFDGDNTGHKISRANKDYEKYYSGTADITENDFAYELKDGGLYLRYPDGGYQNFDYIVSGDTLKLSERYKNEYKTYERVSQP